MKWSINNSILTEAKCTLSPIQLKHPICPLITPSHTLNSPFLFVPSERRMINAIDIDTGNIIYSFASHFGKIGGICLRPRYQELISCGYDGEILFHSSLNSPENIQNEKDEWSDAGE